MGSFFVIALLLMLVLGASLASLVKGALWLLGLLIVFVGLTWLGLQIPHVFNVSSHATGWVCFGIAAAIFALRIVDSCWRARKDSVDEVLIHRGMQLPIDEQDQSMDEPVTKADIKAYRRARWDQRVREHAEAQVAAERERILDRMHCRYQPASAGFLLPGEPHGWAQENLCAGAGRAFPSPVELFCRLVARPFVYGSERREAGKMVSVIKYRLKSNDGKIKTNALGTASRSNLVDVRSQVHDGKFFCYRERREHPGGTPLSTCRRLFGPRAGAGDFPAAKVFTAQNEDSMMAGTNVTIEVDDRRACGMLLRLRDTAG